MPELSPEDSLRLNVMLANKPQAIRIDESRMTVYALSEKGEMEIPLHATCADEPYLKKVRELLSMHVLGTPSGYPTHIQRWTRMGQLRNENIEDLLLLGEPEAVVAVVYSEALTTELARRAWWAMEDAENARQMLQIPTIAQGEMGQVLANYLFEFLPFETEAEKIMQTVRLILQPGLLSGAQRQDLWKRAKRKNAFYVGFLATVPDALPDALAGAAIDDSLAEFLQQQQAAGNALAALLARVFSPSGQRWLMTFKAVLEKPVNQDVVNEVLDVAAGYFAAARPEGRVDATIEELLTESQDWLHADEQARVLLERNADWASALMALRVLSGSGYGLVRPVFGRSDAIGTLMRRKLQPVMQPYLEQVSVLLG